MDRRTFISAAALPTLAATAAADLEGVVGQAAETKTTTTAETAFDPRIRDVRYPLAFVPAVREPGEPLRVELEPGLVEPELYLRPQVGEARPRIDLEPLQDGNGDRGGKTDGGGTVGGEIAESEIWRGRRVEVRTFETPRLRGDVVDGAYDLHLEHADGTDVQHGAVHLTREFPDEPEVVVLTDPHAGDVFVMQAAAERAAEDGDPDEFLFVAGETLGVDPEDDRWAAFRRAVAEVNLLDPDLVITPGDYVDGQDVPEKYYLEYEDAHAILAGITAPTYTTIGNHDGYVQSGTDGIELYTSYFAPEYYSVDVRPDLHIVSANTYDWDALDRTGVSYGVSAWGGQIRAEQFAWLESDLLGWRAAHPDGHVLVVGHHNPTALQDASGDLAGETDGAPVAEQVGRGVDSQFVQGGQIWHGDNRLAWRDLLAEADVAAYVTGHTHRDRLARYHEGDVVRIETPGPSDFETARLHYVERAPDHEGASVDDSWSQAELREVLTEPAHGPLFVETTTASSGTGQYWGWRHLPLDLDGVDPSGTGYPADEAFLDEALNADRDGWNADHADLGLFSHPTYRLAATIRTWTDREVVVRFESDLATDFEGSTVVSLADCPGVVVDGGRRVWRRSHDGRQDVRVAFDVPAGGERTVRVACRGGGS